MFIIKQKKFTISSNIKVASPVSKCACTHTEAGFFLLNCKFLARMKTWLNTRQCGLSTLSLYAAHTALCEHVIRRNDAQSHHILSLSSHIKNLPSQLHSSPNSRGHLSNPMLPIWTAGPLKVSPPWQGKCLFFKVGERREAFLSVHITGLDSSWSALLFCGSNLCGVSTYSEFWVFVV